MIVPTEKSQPELPPYDEDSTREFTDSKSGPLRNIHTSTYGSPEYRQFSSGLPYAARPLQPDADGVVSESSSLSTSFSRPLPGTQPYSSFDPIFLVCRGQYLYKGFLPVPPPSSAIPHPFITHDVNEGDWLNFLAEIQSAATLTEKDLSRSHLPIISIIPIVNSLSAYGIRKYMKGRKESSVVKVIDFWNHHFFRPRKLEVILTKGPIKLSGTHDHPIADLHVPETSSTRSSLSDRKEGKLKGKEKAGTADDPEDNTYRLFVVSI
ncbi:uncharacterized protein LACBIDRAFT_310263 [Laccaria bicolor S238N-H82]|uniref:Predicted protein n=1 Tax=Laccaria bicolor (strain S238N-H82 / ATCC MYA-4686) TaxID=486041 RepID=B0DTU4_LACBS|nr:uncharacterized protein LACBIDRAFT_310263 [Laccaria bicolor S238N-H82]EDR02041.1 predicted protein [Laccaria bicolor S238N-H82]|eukprot:XP_001887432.1 predicted protein [Laccaria bicolor S238N-H82]